MAAWSLASCAALPVALTVPEPGELDPFDVAPDELVPDAGWVVVVVELAVGLCVPEVPVPPEPDGCTVPDAEGEPDPEAIRSWAKLLSAAATAF